MEPLYFSVNPWPLFLAGISAAEPQPSLSHGARLLTQPRQQSLRLCPADCPNDTDRADGLAKLLHGIRYSTSTTQWEFGSTGPYTMGLY